MRVADGVSIRVVLVARFCSVSSHLDWGKCGTLTDSKAVLMSSSRMLVLTNLMAPSVARAPKRVLPNSSFSCSVPPVRALASRVGRGIFVELARKIAFWKNFPRNTTSREIRKCQSQRLNKITQTMQPLN